MNGPIGNSPSYLDKLSAEELWNIVRHLSTYPRRSDWAHYINCADIRALCHGSCSLSNLFRNRFKAVSILGDYESHHALRRGAPASAFCVQPAALADIVSNNDIEISAVKILNPRDIQTCLPLLSKSILSLRLPPPYLVSSTARHALVEHCSVLRSLSMSFLSLADDLHSTKPQCLSFASLWAVVGGSLECLEFRGNKATIDAMLDGLKENCRKLRSIHVEWEDEVTEMLMTVSDYEDSFETFTDLYTSLGAQLESVTIDVLPVEYCRAILNACPNVQIRFIVLDTESLATMIELGPSISSLKLEIDASDEEFLNNVALFKNAAASCTNLLTVEEESYVQAHGGSLFATLFDKSMENLEHVRLKSLFNARLLLENATSFCSLRSLSCNIYLPERQLLDQLAQRNGGLEDVRIKIDHPSESPIDWEATGAELLEPFSKCKQLRELTLNKLRRLSELNDNAEYSEIIATSCLAFKSSRVHIEIWGTVYLA